MYTILENARIVLALLKKHNIRHIVLSPGGSNIPIVQGCQQDPFFKCYSVVDERSAMYFAIGLYLQTGEIIATSCTSAQATRNYLPGLTEAYYKQVPILAITMSKHPKFLGQEYMQCPIQTSLPVDSVKKSFSLPRISNEHDRELCIRTANEAILELTHHSNGPVQLNIEELDNETWKFDEKTLTLPEVRVIRRIHYWETFQPGELIGKKILLLIGEHRPFSVDEVSAIERFSRSHDVFIYGNHISNYHGDYALNANPLIATITASLFQKEYRPDLVITIGGLTGDYAVFNAIRNTPNSVVEHWRVSTDGNVVDTYGKLTRVYECNIIDFFTRMSLDKESEHSYYAKWKEGISKIDYNIDVPLSNLYIALSLSNRIPSGSILNLAILNSLRVWNYMQIPSTVKAFSNVAAFGIDGCMSTLLGESMETENLSFHITGDLAFYYDMNALGIRHINNNVRILLCNNNGGMEFKFGALVKKTDVGSYIAADNHFKDSEGWAKTNDFLYISVRTKEELENAIPLFIASSDKPILMEVFTTPDDEREANNTFKRHNWRGTKGEEFKEEVKNVISDAFGESAVEAIIKIVKK